MLSPIKYAHYTLQVTIFTMQQRIELVTLVQDNELSINQAAKEIGINPSTAKLIMKKYRREGTFAMRKVRQVPEEPQILLPQPEAPK
jgi:transposase-like protein